MSIHDAVQDFATACRRLGATKPYGDGYSFALGATKTMLRDAIERLPRDAQADILASLARMTKAFTQEADEASSQKEPA